MDVAICQGGVGFTAGPNIWHRCGDGVTSKPKSHHVHPSDAAREKWGLHKQPVRFINSCRLQFICITNPFHPSHRTTRQRARPRRADYILNTLYFDACCRKQNYAKFIVSTVSCKASFNLFLMTLQWCIASNF